MGVGEVVAVVVGVGEVVVVVSVVGVGEVVSVVVGVGEGDVVVEEGEQLQAEPVQLQPVPRRQACSGLSDEEGGV